MDAHAQSTNTCGGPEKGSTLEVELQAVGKCLMWMLLGSFSRAVPVLIPSAPTLFFSCTLVF